MSSLTLPPGTCPEPSRDAERGRGRPFTSLRTRRDFDRVFQNGKRLRCGPFTLVLFRGSGCYRVGFKIGKKIGKAVVRNRLRRRFRACFEAYLPPSEGADLVVLASPATAALSPRRFTSLIERALTRSGFGRRLGTDA